MKTTNLTALANEAKTYYVAGASAGQRYNAVLGHPLYLDHASGSKIYDIDGNEYLDYHVGAGAGFFGWNHPRLKQAVMESVEKGFFMNFDTPYHLELAKLVRRFFPCAERIRLCNTGMEATLGAIRLARSVTGRDLLLRFEGHFHGMYEEVWYNHNTVAAADKFGEVETTPDSEGFLPASKLAVKNVVFNDVEALEHIVAKYRGHFAAMIMEPLSFDCGCMIPREGYLQKVREICDREGIVLIFDEVLCGLRAAPGSMQLRYGVTPDLTAAAKAIGGGFPIALLAGKAPLMEHLNPLGKTVMSGTYSGSLMPVVASVECLKMASEPGFYDKIDTVGDALYSGLNDLFAKHGIPGHARGVGARFALYFGVEDPEDDYDFRKVAAKHDYALYKKFVTECLPLGLYFHDTAGRYSPAHYGFSAQHSLEDIAVTLDKIDTIFAKIK